MASAEVSRILSQIDAGDPVAAEQLFPLVYDELRKMAAVQLIHERPGQTLQATALVHEAYLRLLGEGEENYFVGRRHFFGAAAEAMRRILVDQARAKKRLKRGGERVRVELQDVEDRDDSPDLLALHEALDRLAEEDPLAAEIVQLKFFAGVGRESIAKMLGVTVHEVRSKWDYARSWLQVAIDS